MNVDAMIVDFESSPAAGRADQTSGHPTQKKPSAQPATHAPNHNRRTWPGRGPAVAAGEAEPTVVAGEL